MKKKNLLLILVLLFVTVLTIHGQVVNQDAEGKSTILFPGGTIGIEIGETALTFNFMNIQYNTEDAKKGNDENSPKGFIWGVNARAENKTGIGKLFDSGKVVPGSSFLVTLGYLWENKKYMDMARWENSTEQAIWENLKEEERSIRAEKKLQSIEKYNEGKLLSLLKNISKTSDIAILKRQIQQYLPAEDSDEKLKAFQEKPDDSKLKEITDKIINDVKSLSKEIENNDIKLDGIKKDRIAIKKSFSYKRLALFTRIGINAGSFKSYTPSESSALKDQFKKIEYSSFSIQIGANLQLIKGMLLGFAAGFQKANNLESLKKREFTLNTTQSSENQKLVEEEKIIAYSGEFKKFDRIDIDSDIVGFVKVGETHVMTPYGYFRWRIPIGTGDSFANTMNVGIGGNFFTEKGKHLGGLFLELPDITNELKDNRKLLNRLTFGITVKISFAKSNSWIPWLK